MARRKRRGTAVKVHGYTMRRNGKLVHVKGYSRKRPKRQLDYEKSNQTKENMDSSQSS